MTHEWNGAVPAKTSLVAAVLACTAVLAGCGSDGEAGSAHTSSTTSNRSSSTAPASVIKAARVPGLGMVLVNAKGYVLYMFPPDRRAAGKKKVTCTGACAGTWPPATIPSDATPKAGPKVRESLLGTVANPNKSGTRVVTYNGWPLYTYLPDVKPGRATGHALDLNGGYWYVMRPSGKVIKHPVGGKKGHT